MNSGRGAGPEDPQGTPGSTGTPSGEDQDPDDWATWRQGPSGYSRPVPPGSESGAGAHERPPPRHPYEDRVPSQPPASGDRPAERSEAFWAPRRPAEGGQSYPPPETHEGPRSR